MATVKDSIPHIVRTAHERRHSGSWPVTLTEIEQVNSTIRLLKLSLPKDGPTLKHLPGQYVDLSIPNIPTVGGFTITSPPQTASAPRSSASLPPNSYPHIELAIQSSPSNPPAAFLWLPQKQILDSSMSFRVGGNFAFPPLTLSRSECEEIDNVVFIAGGVGINPIMSMVSAMDWQGKSGVGGVGGMRRRVRVLYGSKRERAGRVLFEERLEEITKRWEDVDGVDIKLTLFETGEGAREASEDSNISDNAGVRRRKGRITHTDLMDALGPVEGRTNAVVYVCGVPGMTDEFIDVFKGAEGMDERRVLCEKWW